MKRRRLIGLLAVLGLSAATLTACISNEARGWGAPAVIEEETQLLSPRRGKLDGVNIQADRTPAWTGTLSAPLPENETRLLNLDLSPTDTVFQGDILFIESEMIRVRSLSINGAERTMHLDRGFGGTTASAHPAGATIEAFRRPWRFPDDWNIRSGDARNLDGIYGAPVIDSDGVVYVGDYGGWVYAFRPSEVNFDAANDNQQPGVAISDLGESIIGGLALDEDGGMLYATSGSRVFALSTDRLKAALAAGGGEVAPEPAFSFKAGKEIWGAPTFEDGVLYVASLDSKLYALDAATGNVQWMFDGVNGLTSTPVIAGDLVLVSGFEGAVFAVDKADGTLAWDFAAGNWVLATPVVHEDTVYVGDFDGFVHALDVETGENRWSVDLDRGKIRASVAVAGDVVVVGTESGWLVGLDRNTQQRIWEQDVGSGILADLKVAGDEVLIAPEGCTTLAGGEVKTYYRAVDPQNGTLRRVEGIC